MIRLLLLFALLAQDGTALDVYSEPPGALVVLDHRVLGHTPLRIAPIPAGEHELRVSAGEDFKPFVGRVHVQPGILQRLDVTLQPGTARLLRDGVRAAGEGRDEEALALLEQATDEPEAWWWIGRVQMRRGRPAEALEAFRRYADYHPDQPDLYLHLGTLHERLGHPGEAVTAFKLALLKTGRVRLERTGAATWADIAAAGSPTTAEEQLRLAWLYEQKGRMEEALRWLHAAVQQVFPDWSESEGEGRAGRGAHLVARPA